MFRQIIIAFLIFSLSWIYSSPALAVDDTPSKKSIYANVPNSVHTRIGSVGCISISDGEEALLSVRAVITPYQGSITRPFQNSRIFPPTFTVSQRGTKHSAIGVASGGHIGTSNNPPIYVAQTTFVASGSPPYGVIVEGSSHLLDASGTTLGQSNWSGFDGREIISLNCSGSGTATETVIVAAANNISPFIRFRNTGDIIAAFKTGGVVVASIVTFVFGFLFNHFQGQF